MVCLLATLGIYAQNSTITGKVVDNEGLEVIGANISIKGSAGVGTITNIDGQFTFKGKKTLRKRCSSFLI